MPSPALRALLERAATDAGFRAQLLANPALAEGLSREHLKVLLEDLALLNGQLTDEMLDNVAGAGADSRSGALVMGTASDKQCFNPNHNETGLHARQPSLTDSASTGDH